MKISHQIFILHFLQINTSSQPFIVYSKNFLFKILCLDFLWHFTFCFLKRSFVIFHFLFLCCVSGECRIYWRRLLIYFFRLHLIFIWYWILWHTEEPCFSSCSPQKLESCCRPAFSGHHSSSSACRFPLSWPEHTPSAPWWRRPWGSPSSWSAPAPGCPPGRCRRWCGGGGGSSGSSPCSCSPTHESCRSQSLAKPEMKRVSVKLDFWSTSLQAMAGRS